MTSPQAQIAKRMHERMLIPPGLPCPQPSVSMWQLPPHPTVASAQSTKLAAETDVIVIGSGITGCAAAHTLLHHSATANLRVTVLEARTTCSGATGRNGGHLISNIVEMVTAHASAENDQDLREMAAFSEANLRRLQDLVGSMSPEDREAVELRMVTSAAAITDPATLEAIKQTVDKINITAPLTTLEHKVISDREAISSLKFQDDVVGVLEQVGSSALWPYRLVTNTFKMLLANFDGRFALETNTPATSIEYDAASPAPYAVHTPRGTIRAKQVIHCTNGMAAHLLPNMVGKLFPFRGTMSVQAPGPAFPRIGDSVSWSHVAKGAYNAEADTLHTGLYYIQQNAKTGHLWIGGETKTLQDMLTSDDSVVDEPARSGLSTALPRIFKDVEPVEVRNVWSGIMGFTADHKPMVGKVSAWASGRAGDGEWMAAGFNGHGMDKAWLSGEAVAKMAMGEAEVAGFPKMYLVSEERFASLSSEEAANGFASLFF